MLLDLIIYNRLSQLGNVHIFQSGQVITLLLCNNYLLCRPMPMKTQLLKFRMWYLSGCTLAAKVQPWISCFWQGVSVCVWSICPEPSIWRVKRCDSDLLSQLASVAQGQWKSSPVCCGTSIQWVMLHLGHSSHKHSYTQWQYCCILHCFAV